MLTNCAHTYGALMLPLYLGVAAARRQYSAAAAVVSAYNSLQQYKEITGKASS